MKDLDAASLSDVQEWFKTYYGPNNVTVVIAGDITPEVAREKVEKYYGEIPAGPPIAKQEVWIAKRTGTHRGWVQDRVPQARLYRIWNVPEFGSPEEAQLDLVERCSGAAKHRGFTSAWSTKIRLPPAPPRTMAPTRLAGNSTSRSPRLRAAT